MSAPRRQFLRTGLGRVTRRGDGYDFIPMS